MRRDTLKRLAARALEGTGRQLTPHLVEWDISGKCHNPYRTELYDRPFRTEYRDDLTRSVTMQLKDTLFIDDLSDPDWGKPRRVPYLKDPLGPYAVLLSVKCRKCETCLKERADLWAARAQFEIGAASRTWFATLTLSPWHQEVFANLARQYAAKALGIFEQLSQGEQFALRHKFISDEIQKMFKRMRKAGLRFRYFLVVEAHKSGLPHYHLLLHEIGEPIRKRELETFWTYGHSQWRLVPEDEKGRAAWYVAKYLAKTSSARVRASVRYGGSA